MIASARERIASGARPEMRTLGTAGERIALARVVWAGGPPDGRFEIEYATVWEVDDSGLIGAIVLFDVEDAHLARREAWARWVAIEPAVKEWVDFVSAAADSYNDRATGRGDPTYAPDLVLDDHRRTGVGRLDGIEAFAATVEALFALAPDVSVEFGNYWPAWNRRAALITGRRYGTIPDGGPFEMMDLMLFVKERDGGPITRIELFELDALDAALARFENLAATDGHDPLRIPPNSATRVFDRGVEAVEARDWDALHALLCSDLVWEDRGKRALVNGGAEEMVAGIVFYVSEAGADVRNELLATAGDRLAMHVNRWRGTSDAGAFELEKISIIEVDGAGKVRAFVLFDVEDRAAAGLELSDRWIASAPTELPKMMLEFPRAWNNHDLERLCAMFPKDYVFHDRRRTGVGRLVGEDWLASLSALWALSPDARLELLHLIELAPHGTLIMVRMSGTNVEGGDWESLYLNVNIFDGDQPISSELFEPEDLDAARARFEELRPRPRPE